MDWDNIRVFLQVVRAGSLGRAAASLGVNQTTVSRRITALESKLGTHLFERSARKWLLTPLGERLVSSAEHMEEDANALARLAQADSRELGGVLRITVADVCTQKLVLPVIDAFLGRYPQVEIELIATREELNLAAREADIALRTTDTPPANLIGKCIGQLGYAIYGTRELARRLEQEPAEVPCITWVGDSYSRPPWVEKSFPAARRVHRTTDLGLMIRMVRHGMGIAQMPCVFCDPEPDLQRIPAPYIEPGWGLWVLTHVDLRTMARVRIFRDFLIDQLTIETARIEGRGTAAHK